MDNNPQGPYKHYERPTEGRAANQSPSSHRWGLGICVFIIIMVALLPTVHHLSVKNIQHVEQAKEVERVSKRSSHKKSKVRKHKKSSVSSNSSSSKSQSSSEKSGDSYVVKPGDTLSSIAQKNNMSVSDLMQINNLTDSSSIDAGQTLKLK